ncbi:MAG TPA: class I SAM-dependent DNA methyltransferase, partial [Candidatus Marinimicrobia bacterium]|nr:class I SAM-dependent DNA methyltransferase [Candidatus Neomarinimicrobiota bacterium]
MIQSVFEQAFDKGRFELFIRNLLKDFKDKPTTYKGNIIPNAFDNYIRKMERIGKFEDADGHVLDILMVELMREHSIEYARSAQRNFIRWYLAGSRGGQMKDAALVAFCTEGSLEWRFSLIKMQYSLETKKDEITPAKRFSFLVGEKGKSHTAQQQLVKLLKNDNSPLLSDLEEAFNVETMTNEFFEKYKMLALNLTDELEKIIAGDEAVKKEFDIKQIAPIDFAKKLLGQVVFLYFLQRKGWLGLKNGERYGEGDRHFLRSLYQMKHQGENFYNDYLEYLFYEALSKKRVTDEYSRFNCRIPFLNGGLFDPIHFYDWENTDIVIPDILFTNDNTTKEGDTGDGILDIFDRYNFTVNEAEPLDKEVAVDPEMLGKVFERMLEVRERKSKGAFYTPREIVHYMSQESLIHYLDASLNEHPKSFESVGKKQSQMFGDGAIKGQNEPVINHSEEVKVPKEDIELLIKHGEYFLENEEQVLRQGEETKTYKHKIPESIRTHARLIDEKLRDIRVCDPAVGSGAFPVGVMTEIVKARSILFKLQRPGKEPSHYEFKNHAIHHCLYGVDIDPSAVEICKLRLWLSLVVDEQRIDMIEPLPNLDYKIVNGNSLVNMPADVVRDQNLEQEIERLMERYYK